MTSVTVDISARGHVSQDKPCPVNPNILGVPRASLGQSLPSAETSTVTQTDSQDNVVGFPSAVPLPWSLVALSLLSRPLIHPAPAPFGFLCTPPLGWTASGLTFCQLWPPLQGRPVCCLGWWALALTD